MKKLRICMAIILIILGIGTMILGILSLMGRIGLIYAIFGLTLCVIMLNINCILAIIYLRNEK